MAPHSMSNMGDLAQTQPGRIELLEAEQKSWKELDSNMRLNLKDMMFRLENAPSQHSTPALSSEDMDQQESWLREINSFRTSLSNRYADAITRINRTNAQWEASSLAIEAENLLVSKELGKAVGNEDADAKRASLRAVVNMANMVVLPQNIRTQETSFLGPT